VAESVHFTGIKGTGMSSLAVLYKRLGSRVTGSDTPQRFYTDELLENHGISVSSGFCAEAVAGDCSLLISSSAYLKTENPEIQEAGRRSIRVLSYPQALSELASQTYSVAVAGTHGKTSVSSMIDYLSSCSDLSCASVYGSFLSGRRVETQLQRPLDLLCFEACEYDRHLLAYHPDAAVLTNISYEHPDIYHDIEEIKQLFKEFLLQIKPAGILIYCADDLHTVEVVHQVLSMREDITAIAYGLKAGGKYAISEIRTGPGETRCRTGFLEFPLLLPGRHMALNMVGAIAAVEALCPSLKLDAQIIAGYPGVVRRSEFIGSAAGIRVVDDYAHHPEEIQATLEALREFYQPGRIFVDFIPHTLSRTEALFNGFIEAFSAACDTVLIHPVYRAAREQEVESAEHIELSRKLASCIGTAVFVEDQMQSLNHAMSLLTEGDLFVTMGAGNNRSTGKKLLELLQRGNT
jgi:UDP-N-acetylmuramate--alanine ligase